MKTSLIILAAGAALALSSCASVQYTASSVKVDSDVYNLTVADMDVSTQKVSKTTSWKWNPLNTVSVAVEKDNTTAQLLEEAGADVLVEPQYVVKRRGIFRGGSVTVTGFPAKYKSFRSMTKDDAEILSLANGNPVLAAGQPCIVAGGQPCQMPSYASTKRVSTAKKQSVFRKEDYPSRKFINIVGGGAFNSNDSQYSDGEVGLMFGKYGRRWGWYVKGMLSFTNDNDEGNGTAGYVTGGVIKTLSRNFNFFLGAGVGASFDYHEERYSYNSYTDVDTYFSVPVELGFQWSLSRFNILAGVNCNVVVASDNPCNIGPFVGIGYTF